jgi:hypothetical protein
MLVVDIERPLWPARIACEVAGLGADSPSVVRKWRRDGLDLGKHMRGKAGGWLFSTLDTGELSVVYVLRALGVPVAAAIKQARRERKKLKTVLIARLEEGYWPLAMVRVETQTPIPMSRGFSLGQLAERLIEKFQLPLAVVDTAPPEKELAAIIVEVVSRYVASVEFEQRCDKFRKEVLARGTPTNWPEISVRLGVPLWIIEEGNKGIAEEADEAAEGEGPPISIRHLLRERLGVNVVGGLL